MDADKCIARWKAFNQNDKTRYLSKNWPGLVEELCDSLYEIGIRTFDDIAFYKKEIKEFLMTEDGLRGKGKHSDNRWSKNFDDGFDGIIANFLIDKRKELGYPEYEFGYMDYRPEIAEWVKKEYGSNSPELIREAHKILSPVWKKAWEHFGQTLD